MDSTTITVDHTASREEDSTLSPLLTSEDDTVPGAVDFKCHPAIRSKHGRWRSASFIIAVEMAERLAYYGVGGNLINFLTGKLGQSTAKAAANVNAWNGVASLLPILGAVIADSFLGRYYTIITSSLVYILGLGLLTLSAMLPSLNCESNGEIGSSCSGSLQVIIFFVALYLVAAGQGGHKPCTQAFGADQFDGEDPGEKKEKSSFFNWWYFGVCLGGLLGNAVISYVQENLSWGLGFGIPCIILVIALFLFLLGTVTYRYVIKGEGHSPFVRIGRVFSAAARNWRSIPYDKEETEVTQNREIWLFRILNKALLVPSIPKENQEICSLHDVEETKSLLRLFPIGATCLVFAIVFSQPPTFFTKQGVTLDRSIGPNFAIPAASLQGFIGIIILTIIPIYDRVFVPIVRAVTGKPAGVTMLQRIGIGLFISIICMVVAAIVEEKRLQTAIEYGLVDLPNVTIPMRIWWLVPQYALFGTAEAFTMVGLQEFFYDQVPNDLRSVGMSLYLSIFGIGSLLSSLVVSIIDKSTRGSGGEGWFPNNLNQAHIDYFYWLLAGLSAIGLALFICCSRSYTYKTSKAQ